MKKLAAVFAGKSAAMMKPPAAERLTGYVVGGISPFGQKKPVPTAIEQVDALKSAYPGACSTGRNIASDAFDDVLWHPGIVARQIGAAALSEECGDCQVRSVCGGGHYAHRYRAGDGFRNPSVYCPALQELIVHIRDQVRADLVRIGVGGRS